MMSKSTKLSHVIIDRRLAPVQPLKKIRPHKSTMLPLSPMQRSVRRCHAHPFESIPRPLSLRYTHAGAPHFRGAFEYAQKSQKARRACMVFAKRWNDISSPGQFRFVYSSSNKDWSRVCYDIDNEKLARLMTFLAIAKARTGIHWPNDCILLCSIIHEFKERRATLFDQACIVSHTFTPPRYRRLSPSRLA